MIVLDTNVVSELMRPEPAPQVATWVRVRDRGRLVHHDVRGQGA